MVAIARTEQKHPGAPVKREAIAEAEQIPPAFLNDILRALRLSELLRAHRGPEGGWTLGRPADSISVADIIRVLEGPLASVRGIRPHELSDHGVDEPFVSLWVATRVALRSVLEHVSVAQLADRELPEGVRALLDHPGAWDAR